MAEEAEGPAWGEQPGSISSILVSFMLLTLLPTEAVTHAPSGTDVKRVKHSEITGVFRTV